MSDPVFVPILMLKAPLLSFCIFFVLLTSAEFLFSPCIYLRNIKYLPTMILQLKFSVKRYKSKVIVIFKKYLVCDVLSQ